MSPDRVSVVIATRDRSENLGRSLARLAALPERPPIIVVDNGSRDGTVEAVRREHPDVEVVALGENLGAVARNIGVQHATTPYVAFADDDSWWAPGALVRATDLLDASPRLAVLASRILVGDGERLDPTSAAMAASPLPAPAGLPGPAVLGFIACGAVVRREAFLAAGGFHRVLFFFGEEQLLALDLARAGWQLAYVDEVVAHHHPAHHGSPRVALAERNRVLSSWMRRPWGVVAHDMASLVRGSWLDRAEREALAGVLRRLPRALAERRVIPRELERSVRLLEAPT